MSVDFAARVALPILLVAFVLVLMVWPVVRLRRETGVSALALHRETAPGQRLVGVVFLVIQLAVLALVIVYAARGPGPLGVWALPAFVGWLGIALGIFGVLLVAIAQRQMGASFRIGIDDAETALVQSGLFGVVRNPIFTGLLVLLVGLVLAVPCYWTLGSWIAATLAVAKQTRLEEDHLLAQHGSAYRSYASQVGRFVPGIGRISEAAPAANSE